MLPLPNLNDQRFQDIVEQSIKKIERYTTGWTDRDIHDPGIMLIELFSYLKEMQQERINRVGEKSFNKFLELLGIVAENTTAAYAHVAFESGESFSLPEGAKLLFKDIVFETERRIQVIDNTIYDLSDFYAFGAPQSEGNFFEICFKKPLPEKVNINIYIELSNDYPSRRNPIVNDEEFIPTSVIRWEYYGGDAAGWLPIDIQLDKTYHMLFSGMIIFSIDGEHREKDGKYPIRGVLVTDLYEVPPKLKSVRINAVKVVQQDTKCKSITFSYEAFKENKMIIDHCLCYEGVYELYVNSKNCWRRAEDLGVAYKVKKEENNFFRMGTSKRDELFLEFNEGDSQVLKLVVYSKEFYSKRIIGSGTSFCNQIYKINCAGIWNDELEVMVKGKENNWDIYDMVSTFDNSTSWDKHYIFYEQEQMILFGDNEFGKSPSAGTDNCLFTSLKTTLGEGGNIAKGKLTSLLDDINFPAVSVCQFEGATKGRNKETLDEIMHRIPKVLNKIERAVIKSDYEEIAKGTQGLMLENVTALPLYKPKAVGKTKNCVTVVIEPFCLDKPIADERYLKNIKKHLNRKKMLTTQIYVSYPVYMGLEVYCEVVIKERYKHFKEEITKSIEKHIKSSLLGAAVSHGAICGVIERTPCVLYVKYLKLEIPMADIKKTELGDVEPPFHARVYVKKVDIVECHER